MSKNPPSEKLGVSDDPQKFPITGEALGAAIECGRESLLITRYRHIFPSLFTDDEKPLQEDKEE